MCVFYVKIDFDIQNIVKIPPWPYCEINPTSTKNYLIVWFAEHSRKFPSFESSCQGFSADSITKSHKGNVGIFLRSHLRARRRKTLTLLVGRRKLNLEETRKHSLEFSSCIVTFNNEKCCECLSHLLQSNSIRLLSLFTILHSSFNCAPRWRN